MNSAYHEINNKIKRGLQIAHAHTFLALIAVGGLIVLMGFISYRFAPVMIFGALGVIVLAMIILRNPWHGIYLFAFFLPFERVGSYDISGVTVRASQVTALLVMIAIALYYLGRKKFPVPSNPIIWPLSIFIIAGLFGLLNAPQLERSVLVLGFQIFTCAIALSVPFVIQKKQHVQKLLPFMFASMLLVTLFGLFQFAGDLVGLPPEITGLRELYTKEVLGFPRVQSTALEPLYFANYLLIPLCVLLALFLSRIKSIKQIYIVGLLGLGITNLVLTVARGGYIAFAICACLLALTFLPKLFTWRNFFYTIVTVGLGLIVLTQVVSYDQVYDQFVGHVSNLFEGASYSERVEMFEVATRAWQEHPIIGIGSGSFGPYENFHPYIVPDHGWRIVNNEYLELLAENGTIGFTAMMLIFIIVIIRSVKALLQTSDSYLKAVHAGFLIAFLGILVQYNTFSILYIVHIWFVIGMLVALQNMILKPSKS